MAKTYNIFLFLLRELDLSSTQDLAKRQFFRQMLIKQEGDLYFLPTEVLNLIFHYCYSDYEKILENEDIEFLKKNIYSKKKYIELYCGTDDVNDLHKLDEEWKNTLDNLKKIVILVTHKKGNYIERKYIQWEQQRQPLVTVKYLRKIKQDLVKVEKELKDSKRRSEVLDKICVFLSLAKLLFYIALLVWGLFSVFSKDKDKIDKSELKKIQRKWKRSLN